MLRSRQVDLVAVCCFLVAVLCNSTVICLHGLRVESQGRAKQRLQEQLRYLQPVSTNQHGEADQPTVLTQPAWIAGHPDCDAAIPVPLLDDSRPSPAHCQYTRAIPPAYDPSTSSSQFSLETR